MAGKAIDSEAFDPGIYSEPPQLDTNGMLALGRALVYLAPAPPPPPLLAPLFRLKQAWEELNSLQKLVIDSASQSSSRKPSTDVAMDNAWTALYERLHAYALLPDTEIPYARRAQDLVRLLFPDGLGFLKLPFEQEWSESGSRLRIIDRLKLTEEIDALAGIEFLRQVRSVQDAYSKLAGVAGNPTTQAPPAEDNNIRDLRAALGRCISQYALKVLTLADEDRNQVRRLLAPLVEHHRLAERRPSSSGLFAANRLPSDNRITPDPRLLSESRNSIEPRPSGEARPSLPGDRKYSTSRPSDSGIFRTQNNAGTVRPVPDAGSGPLRDSGLFRVNSNGTVRPVTDSGSGPLRDSGLFRVKKPGE